MSQPYPSEDEFWTPLKVEVLERYARAGVEPDALYPIWFSRTGYDIGAGMRAEQSKAKHLRELDEALGLPVPVPVNAGALVGMLRTDGDRCFIDDRGPIIPTAGHAGDVFAIFANGHEDIAKTALSEMADAGYGIARSWVVLNPKNKATDVWARTSTGLYTHVYPGTADIVAFAELLKSFGIVWHCALGGLIDLTHSEERELYTRIADAMQIVGPEWFVLPGEVNECRDTCDGNDNAPDQIAALVNIIRQRFPDNLYALSAYTGTEDPEDLRPYQPSWQRLNYLHGYRGGAVANKKEHRWTFGYEALNNGLKRLSWDGEPCGPWSRETIPGNPLTRVSAQDGDHQFTDEALGLIASGSYVGRSVYAYMCSSGVKYLRPFSEFPGFRSVPALARVLPQDLHTFATLCHGGDRWRGTRVLVASEHVRPDHAVHHDGRFVCTISVDRPGRYRVPIERRFTEGVVIHPGTLEQTPIEGSGEVTIECEYGRIVMGRCV